MTSVELGLIFPGGGRGDTQVLSPPQVEDGARCGADKPALTD